MPRIDQMFAFVVADAGPDDEGVLSMPIDGFYMPLVGADTARCESLRPYAQQMANFMGKPVKLVRFTQMETVETLEPYTVI